MFRNGIKIIHFYTGCTGNITCLRIKVPEENQVKILSVKL
jgi:hypothetical protein